MTTPNYCPERRPERRNEISHQVVDLPENANARSGRLGALGNKADNMGGRLPAVACPP